MINDTLTKVRTNVVVSAEKSEELSKKIGKSSSHISNLIRILDLDDEIHQTIIDGKISMGHARALIGVPNAVEKAKEIFEKKLSVRDVEKSTSKINFKHKNQLRNLKLRKSFLISLHSF